MGVKGLFQFFKRYEKEINIPTFLKNKSVAVDIFWFIHQSKGNINNFKKNIHNILEYSKQVYCVFDGKPSPLKYESLKIQAEHRQQLLNTIKCIEDFLDNPFRHLSYNNRYLLRDYVESLKKQAWVPSPEYIYQIKEWLLTQHCYIYEAKEEADDVLIELEKKGMVDVIITNDSDLLVLGSAAILRQYTPEKGGFIDKVYIKSILNFTEIMWNDFMYLCSKMKNVDIQLIYSYICTYKDISMVIQKCDILYNQECIEDITIAP